MVRPESRFALPSIATDILLPPGFIDEILGYSSPSVPEAIRQSQGIFGNILPSRKPGPVDLTTAPTVLPTAQQTKSLAVLLSHELAHLVLSHTLESYASTSLLIPQFSKLGSDGATWLPLRSRLVAHLASQSSARSSTPSRPCSARS